MTSVGKRRKLEMSKRRNQVGLMMFAFCVVYKPTVLVRRRRQTPQPSSLLPAWERPSYLAPLICSRTFFAPVRSYPCGGLLHRH